MRYVLDATVAALWFTPDPNRVKALRFRLDFRSLQIPLFETTPLLPRATNIALQTRLSIADGLYLALAEQEGCPLLTNDPKIIKNTRKHFSFVVDFATIP